MKLGRIKGILSKYPYWKNLKEENAVIEVAYKRLSEQLSKVEYLNEESSVPEKSLNLSWGLNQFTLVYIDNLLKEKEYMNSLNADQRKIVYEMAQQRVANLYNNTTSDAYYIDSMRAGTVVINPNTDPKQTTSLKSMMLPLVKLVTLWFNRETLNTIAKVYLRVLQFFTESKVLTTAASVYIAVKHMITSGHTLNVTMAVLVRIRDILNQVLTLGTKAVVYVHLITDSFNIRTTLAYKALPMLRLMTSLVTEKKHTLGTSAYPTLKLK